LEKQFSSLWGTGGREFKSPRSDHAFQGFAGGADSNKTRIGTGFGTQKRHHCSTSVLIGAAKMSQQWLSVIGLSLNLVGVVLLVIEWWRAFFGQMQSFGGRLRPLLHQAQNLAVEHKVAPKGMVEPPKDAAGALTRELEVMLHELEALVGELKTLGPRSRLLIVGASMIILGIVSQIVGAWPGGIPALYIFAA
jgi:hypothetical protein